MSINRKKLVRFLGIAALVIVLLFALLIIFTIFHSSSIDKRIAKFEARRKIPDSENAAIIYDKIVEDANKSAIFSDSNFLKLKDNLEFRKPWKSKDHPETAEWIKNQQKFINEVLKASRFEKCYFPIPTNTEEDSLNFIKFATLLKIAQLIDYAANNDIAEGEINDAIEKYQFVFKLAEHLYQQPLSVDYMIGRLVESITVDYLNELTLKTEISEEQLKAIEKIPLQTDDTWQEQSQQLFEGERLFADKRNNKHAISVDYISAIFTGHKILRDSLKERYYKAFLPLLAKKRGNRILIGLRKYKNQNGQWPESLEQIKSFVEPIVLIDPQNNSSFVYKRTENGFTLYSRGPNNIDEDGKSAKPADDYIIWP